MEIVIVGNEAAAAGYDLTMAERYGDTIGGRIHQARKDKGLTMTQIAATLGVRPSHLSNVENNNVRLSLPMFAQLVDILGVSADWVLGRPDAAPTDELDAAGITEEAEAAANLIDSIANQEQRRRILAIVQAVIELASEPDDDDAPADDIAAERERFAASVLNGKQQRRKINS